MNVKCPINYTHVTLLSASGAGVRKNRSGITLVEVSVSTLLVGLLVIASLQSVGNIRKTWTTTNQLADGQGLAQDLIQEIVSQLYTDPTDPGATTFGPEAGETGRTTFNDVDDYLGWSESPVKDASGTALTGFTGWSRSVLVEKIDPANYTSRSNNASDKGLRAITVTVTSPAGKTTSVKVYRSNVGGTLQPMSANTTLVTWVGCTLQLGTNSPATTGIAPSNHAKDE